MKLNIKITLIIILNFFYIDLFSQIQIYKNYSVFPFNDSVSRNTILSKSFFGGEINKGFFSAKEAHAWNIKFASFVELLRFKNNLTLAFINNQELMANSYNNLTFNPRNILFNETVKLFKNMDNYILNIGISHHCKHDIDNASPYDENIPQQNYIPSGREIILSDINIGFIKAKQIKSLNLKSFFDFSSAYYIFCRDYRLPYNTKPFSWSNIFSSLSFNYVLKYNPSFKYDIYFKIWDNIVIFKDKIKVKNNFKIESGFSFFKSQNPSDFFIAFEHFFDDLSQSIPQKSNVFFIGVRIRNNIFL